VSRTQRVQLNLRVIVCHKQRTNNTSIDNNFLNEESNFSNKTESENEFIIDFCKKKKKKKKKKMNDTSNIMNDLNNLQCRVTVGQLLNACPTIRSQLSQGLKLEKY